MLLGRKRRLIWSLWRPLCGIGNFWGKSEISYFLKFFRKYWKIKISKVGGILWRLEVYRNKEKYLQQWIAHVCLCVCWVAQCVKEWPQAVIAVVTVNDPVQCLLHNQVWSALAFLLVVAWLQNQTTWWPYVWCGVRSYVQYGCNVEANFWRLIGCSKSILNS